MENPGGVLVLLVFLLVALVNFLEFFAEKRKSQRFHRDLQQLETLPVSRLIEIFVQDKYLEERRNTVRFKVIHELGRRKEAAALQQLVQIIQGNEGNLRGKENSQEELQTSDAEEFQVPDSADAVEG